MLDNKLNHVLVTPEGRSEIDRIRQLFIALDNELIKIGEKTQLGHRPLHISRTHLETALMYANKCIAIQNEVIKGNPECQSNK